MLMFLILILFQGSYSENKNETENQDYYDHIFFEQADSLRKNNEYEKVLRKYSQAVNHFDSINNPYHYIAALSLLGNFHTYFYQFDSAKYYLSKSYRYLSSLKPDSPLMADIYHRLGEYFDYTREPDSAIFFLQKSLELRKMYFGEISLQVVDSYHAIAAVYRYTLLDYYYAEKNYRKALSLCEALPSSPDRLNNLAFTFYNLATTNRLKGDHRKGITYATQALTHYREYNNEDKYHISLCYDALANCYYHLDKYELAIQYYHLAIRHMKLVPSVSGDYLPDFYTNLGSSYTELKNMDSAVFFIQKAVGITLSQDDLDSAQLADSYQQLGMAYVKGDFVKSIHYLMNSLQLNQNLKNRNVNLTNLYLDLGKYYQKSGDYINAISAVQHALEIINRSNIRRDLNTNSYNMHNIEGANLLAQLYMKVYSQSYQKEYLDSAFISYCLLDKLLVKQSKELSRESAKLNISNNYKNSYEQALNCAYELYMITDEDSILSSMYTFMENNKARLLADNLLDIRQKESLGVPDSLIGQVQSLVAKLTLYNDELENLNIQNVDSSTYFQLQSKVYNFERQIDTLESHLERQYSYLSVSSAESNVSKLSYLKRYLAKKNALFIEYFWGDSNVFVFGADHQSSFVYKLSELQQLNSNIEKLRNILSNTKKLDENQKQIEFNSYVDIASTLYNVLLKDIIKKREIDIDRILIIPDNKLLYIPFEVLLMEKPNYKNLNYKELDYLSNYYPISYGPSARMLLQNASASNKNFAYKALAFSYESLNNKGLSGINKASIPSTASEVKGLTELIPSIIFDGENATKENFKNSINDDFGIIHLALHGQSDSVELMKSGLIFPSSNNEHEENVLYYYELLDIKLSARLAVLSACEAGVGKFISSEGIMNLARGFHLARCPSVVSTLWKVDDLSTSKVISKFYQNLVDTLTLDKALQASKQSYIANANEYSAHPKFWGGIVLVGNTEAINFDYQTYHKPLITIVILFLILFFLTFILRRKISK